VVESFTKSCYHIPVATFLLPRFKGHSVFFMFNDAYVCLCTTSNQVQVAQAVAQPFADLTTLLNLKSKRAQSNKEARATKKATTSAAPEPPAKKVRAAGMKGRQAPKKPTKNTKQVCYPHTTIVFLRYLMCHICPVILALGN
jgi:bacterioferritin-associated ferredoxin